MVATVAGQSCPDRAAPETLTIERRKLPVPGCVGPSIFLLQVVATSDTIILDGAVWLAAPSRTIGLIRNSLISFIAVF
jgi:hypothetical protein